MNESIEIRPNKGAQERALNSKADVTIFGGAAGSGKSHLMLMRALLQVDDPNFNAIFFRRTTTQLSGAGGLFDEAKDMYRPWKPRIVENTMKMTFPLGAQIKFSHLEYDKNALDHQGLQYSLVVMDEATHFTEYQVTYLMSRLRSKAAGNSQMFMSCNPDPDSFLAKWVSWWLDEEGLPDPEKSGVVRYYVAVKGELKFADTEEELKKNYREHLYVYNPIDDVEVYVPPKTMTFIGGTIFDNPPLIRANPKYLAELNSLPEIEKARLLMGNWKVRAQGSSYFMREWLIKAAHPPKQAVYCRAWDKAATFPSDVYPKPDYTAATKMAKDREGNFYILGQYHPSNRDEADPQVLGRFRERSGRRDQIIELQAQHDGADCAVIFSQDPGSAGLTEYTESAKKLITEGFRVQKDPMPPINSKLTRYTPFSSACENGIVYIVESTFDRETLEAFYTEHEAFNGERSTRLRKDDWPDSTASAFNWLCKKAVIPSFTLEEFTRDNPFGD